MKAFDRLAPRSGLAALVFGGLSALAFEPVGFDPVMPVAIALLCALLSRAGSVAQALLIGWLFGLGQFVVGLNWLPTSFTYQANMPAWLGWVALVLLSIYLAVFPAIAAGLAWRIGRARPLALALGLAGAWGLTEWLRATVFTGFAWNPLAASAVGETRFLVPLIGTYGASMFLVLIGAGIWLVLEKNSKPLLLIAALGTLAGIAVGHGFEPPPATGKPVRIVQPNIGQEQKWRPGLAAEAYARLGRLSAGGAPAPRLLFWPEVAVPEPFQLIDATGAAPPTRLPPLRRAARVLRQGDLLITGAFAVIVDPVGDVTGETNSVFAITRDGGTLGRYDKAHLVPYGEYLPMRPLLSAIGLSQLAPGQGDISHGPGPGTIDLQGWGKVGLQVCYEVIFSGQVIDRENRPDFIFNPSNDAWFGRWGPPQHLAQARLRAAEEGLPVIRSTPTGISAIVDARGRLLTSLPWRTAGVIDGTLPSATPSLTPFARLGNIIPLCLALALLIAAIALSARHRYRTT